MYFFSRNPKRPLSHLHNQTTKKRSRKEFLKRAKEQREIKNQTHTIRAACGKRLSAFESHSTKRNEVDHDHVCMYMRSCVLRARSYSYICVCVYVYADSLGIPALFTCSTNGLWTIVQLASFSLCSMLRKSYLYILHCTQPALQVTQARIARQSRFNSTTC